MVLYFDEYLKSIENAPQYVINRSKSFLSRISEKIHKMQPEDIIEEISQFGSGVYACRLVVIDYLRWLSEAREYNTSALISAILESPADRIYIGVYDLTDLKKVFEQCYAEYEYNYENGITSCSVFEQTPRIFLYLEWYGISSKNALSIKLDDVKNMGKNIYVPALDKEIVIDDEDVSYYIFEYSHADELKRKNGQLCKIKGDNLFRGLKGNLSESSVNRAYSVLRDDRLKRNAVLYAGAYNRLFYIEQKQHEEVSLEKNRDDIKRLLNRKEMSIQAVFAQIRAYKAYKEQYLDYLEKKNSLHD